MARGKTDVPSIAPIKEKRTVGYYVRGFLKYFVLIFFSLCAVVPLILYHVLQQPSRQQMSIRLLQ